MENVAFYDEIHIEKRVAEENCGLLGSIRSNFDIADRACQPRRPYNSTTTQLLSRPITGVINFGGSSQMPISPCVLGRDRF
jgi:hypothetical protein